MYAVFSDVRSDISEYLVSIGLPLDLRTKEGGRQSMDKFYDGGDWQRLICLSAAAASLSEVRRWWQSSSTAKQNAASRPPTAAELDAQQLRRRTCHGKLHSNSPGIKVALKQKRLRMRQACRSSDDAMAKLQSVSLPRGALPSATRTLVCLRKHVRACPTALATMHGAAVLPVHQIERFGSSWSASALGATSRNIYPHSVQYKAVSQILLVGDLRNFSLSALESYHAEVGRVADHTGCKRIEADVGEQRTHRTAAPLLTQEGPTRSIEVKATTTMASSVATRLVAARALNENEQLRIHMRAQSRIALAPELGGGRSTSVNTAQKLSGPSIDTGATVISAFAAFI
eukprot:2888249-Pleurochrysis_carterae.AAC.10